MEYNKKTKDIVMEGSKMETFADYILSEQDLIKKMEIVYYLQKRLVQAFLGEKDLYFKKQQEMVCYF